MPIRHTTVATFPDEPGAEINKAEWNADHTNPDIADVTGLQSALDAKLSTVSVDGTTIQGDGTPGNPLSVVPGSGDVDSVSNADGTLIISPTTGNVVASRAAISGDIVISAGSNVAAIGTGVIVNADVSASAGILLSKTNISLTTTGTSGAATLNTTTGVLNIPSYSTATNITVANEATDNTCFPLFVTAATGDLGPKSNALLKYDSSAGNFYTGPTSTRYAMLGGDGFMYARWDDNASRYPLLVENRNINTLTDQGVGILFNLADDTTNAAISAGRISALKEQTWTTTASTQDAYLSFASALNGTVTNRMRLYGSGSLTPNANDGTALGTDSLSWSDLFLASGGVLNWNNGDAVVTHSAGVLNVTTGDLRVTTAGANSASVVTVGGAQALTNKTIDADSNTITNIENADIKAGAAIAVDKLAATTASRALASDVSGFITASATTSTELGYLSGVTSAIQTQINGKQASSANLTAIAALSVADNNIIVGNGTTWVAESGATARTSLGLGTSATVNTGTSGATIPLLNGNNTYSGTAAFSNTFTLSGTTQNIALGTSQTSGTWTAGGTAQTGAITLGRSTGAQTINIGTGATTNATTKPINIGTDGVSGSITNITLGSAVAGATGTLTVNSPTVNIGSSSVSLNNGAAAGSFRIGADANASTLTALTRKIGRIVAPNYTDAGATPNVFMIGLDSATASNSYLDLGGTSGGSPYAVTDIRLYTSGTGISTTGGTLRASITGANGDLTLATGALILSPLTASTALALDASKNVVSVTNTGTGSNVLATSPTLVTPLLGTPTSGNLSNCTGYAVANLSGLGTGVATFLATPSSANLASAVTDETGSGSLVFGTSPTLTTPAFSGVPTGTVTSGTYTPTLFNTTNVAASTAYICTYMRVGNTVTVAGLVDIDPTLAAPTTTVLGISLPIASNFSANTQAGGVANSASGANTQNGGFLADATNDRVIMAYFASSTANNTFSFSFSYQVI